MAFNQTWNDAFEDVPADGDQIKFGADKIRDLKEGMRERLQIDHEMGEADGAGTDTGVDTGYHKKVTLKVATPGTPAAGYIELGSAADEFYWKGAGGTLRTIADLAKAQTLTNKTLTSPVLNSPDINTPDIDGGTIDGTMIADSPISGASGSFTTLAASVSATLAAISGTTISASSTIAATGAVSGASFNAGAAGAIKWKLFSQTGIGTSGPGWLAATVTAHGLTISNILGLVGFVYKGGAPTFITNNGEVKFYSDTQIAMYWNSTTSFVDAAFRAIIFYV